MNRIAGEVVAQALMGALAVLVAVQSDEALWAANSQTGEKPNFVFILIDDLGWTDGSGLGSKFYQTPHIDRLAQQGMTFSDAYAACTVCSPTRAAVMTGRYPARLHLTDWIAGHKRPFAKLAIPDWKMHLDHEEITIAEVLKANGYATAHIGKWHLGGDEYRPETQGFDVNIGGDHRGQPPSYFAPYRIPSIAEGPPGEYLTDRLTDEAERFIERNRQRPFFLYLAHYAVHTPIQAKKDLIEKYQVKAQPDAPHRNAVYAAMLESVDQSVGRIVGKLRELGIERRTVIFYTSDNGGLAGVTSNAPLRAGKGSPWEGGVRVPLIVLWPGVTRPGSTCAEPVTSVDFFPTIMEIAAAQWPVVEGQSASTHSNPAVPATSQRAQPPTIDGESLVPLLRQSGQLKREAIFWHYPHYHPGGATPYGAVRKGDYKLIEFYEDGRLELYNLREDIGERNNLAAAMPDKAEALKRLLAQWRAAVGAQMPRPNPDYDPSRDGKGKPAAKPKPAPAKPSAQSCTKVNSRKVAPLDKLPRASSVIGG